MNPNSMDLFLSSEIQFDRIKARKRKGGKENLKYCVWLEEK